MKIKHDPAISTMKITYPQAVRSEWMAEDPRRVLASDDGEVLVTFDPITMTGGVYHVAAKLWSMWGPMALDEFLGSLRDRGIEFEDEDARQAWLQALDTISFDA
jgi:hypothetical protein